MAAILHQLDQGRLIDSNGIADGGQILFYATGTLTPAPVYTTAALNVEHSSPIVVAAGAKVPAIYLDSTVTYRRRIVYPDGSVDDTDPYTAGAALASELASTEPGMGLDLLGEPTVAEMLASTVAGRGEGTLWHAGGYRYREAASGATDHHLTTAGGVKLYVVDEVLCDLAFGPLADGTSDDRPAILQWLNALKATGKPGYSPGLRRLSQGFVFDESWSGLTIYGDPGKSEWKFIDGAVFPTEGTDIEKAITASMIALSPGDETTLSDFRVTGITIDGNRANLSATPESELSCGVYVAATGGVYRGVVFENVPTTNCGYIGYSASAGGVRIINPVCRSNRWHGIGVSDLEASGFAFGEPLVIENPITEDNGAYGIDFSRGKTLVSGLWQSRRNAQGGGKTSVNCNYVNIAKAVLEDNVGYGFRNTGAAPDLVLEIDHLEIRGTVNDGTSDLPGQAFNFQTGKRVKIGRLIATDNDLVATADCDVLVGSSRVSIGALTVEGGNKDGFRTSGVSWYDIGFAQIEGCQGRAWYHNASNGIIRGALLRGNNQAGATGNDAPSAGYGGGGSHKLLGTKWEDEDGGVWITQACVLHVDGCDFSAIASGEQVRSAGTGTTVTFGRGNTGIVTYARGTLTANGDGSATTFNAALTPALTALGGQTFNVSLNPKNATSVSGYVNAISSSNLQAGFGTPPTAGTGNVIFDYFVDLEVRR